MGSAVVFGGCGFPGLWGFASGQDSSVGWMVDGVGCMHAGFRVVLVLVIGLGLTGGGLYTGFRGRLVVGMSG